MCRSYVLQNVMFVSQHTKVLHQARDYAGFVKQIKQYDAGGTSDDQGNLSLLVGKRSHSS